jgi:prolipoprotein diacylglyceryltransferase
MEAEIRGTLRLLAWSAAFWTALHLSGREWAGPRRISPEDRIRLALGFVLGALAARAGFFSLHAEALLQRPRLLLDFGTGYSVLFVPLGLLFAAPWRRGGPALSAHLGAGLAALPLALAVARLGCFAAGCCLGLPTRLAWGLRWTPAAVPVHPLALYEVAGLSGLAAGLERVPRRLRPGLALAGVAGLRLALAPLRAPSPLGAPALAPAWIAACWIVLGLVLVSPARQRRLSPAVPGSDRT